jgi:hypothetical protein
MFKNKNATTVMLVAGKWGGSAQFLAVRPFLQGRLIAQVNVQIIFVP